MRVPWLVWDRRHNVASLWVSFGKRLYDPLEVDDLVVAYSAAGRLARVLFLDPRRRLPAGASATEAARAALRLLARHLPERDLAVLRSAARRA